MDLRGIVIGMSIGRQVGFLLLRLLLGHSVVEPLYFVERLDEFCIFCDFAFALTHVNVAP